ncbi:MAG: FHA domain-containing protein [Myxococcota bacterium]
MSRYRLRFLLQEFDVNGPEVVLGRSPDCHITLEDPLVSRRHACIRTAPGSPKIRDLGSRNGVRINGRKIDGEVELNDGDRIRLGTQELVFSVVGTGSREAKPTGFMRTCHACGVPYPEVAPRCPHCGALPEPGEEETTISGVVAEPSRKWTFQLLGDVITRAVDSGRSVEADRLMRRAAREFDAMRADNAPIDAEQLELVACKALEVARLAESSEWVSWVMKTHENLELMPSSLSIERIEELDLSTMPEVKTIISRFVDFWRGRPEADAPTNDLGGLARLERLTR